jgi:chromate transporter
MAAGGVGEVFLAFGRLGLTAFGGPIAHLGYFRTEFVERRRWLDDAAFADLVALCQFLPGPASSQVGMGLGLMRAGRLGAAAAFVGFTAPSAIAMILIALGFSVFGGGAGGLARGLEVAAVAVVAAALLGMVRTLAATRATATIAALGLAVATLAPGTLGQIAAIGLGAAAGLALAAVDRRAGGEAPTTTGADPGGPRLAIGAGEGAAMLALFAALSLALPVAAAFGGGTIDLVDAFWRAGSLVFGGGHVVLPLLQAEMVETGRVTPDAFLAGYGAAQAMPGPLFTFAAFLGTVATTGPGGALGGLVALVAIFAPSWLLVGGCLPFWDRLRRRAGARAAMVGVNAAVVGLLAAAFFDPVWRRGIERPVDVAIAGAAFVALTAWRAPAWAVVVAAAAIGAGLGA